MKVFEKLFHLGILAAALLVAAMPLAQAQSAARYQGSARAGGSGLASGTSGNLQFNNAGILGAVSTSTVDAAGNISLTSAMNAARFLANINGNTSLPDFSFNTDTGTGFTRVASGRVAYSAAGGAVISMASSGLGIAIGSGPSAATLQVSGTSYLSGNVSLTTGYIHVGSPTTIPTCNATNGGNIFWNSTTKCMNYCNETSNVQVTSVAGGCT